MDRSTLQPTFNRNAGQSHPEGILDRVFRLDYTTCFDSVQFAGLRGRVLCRNAHFNRKCAAVTRRTGFAHA
jgi:hypothetical protein